MLQLQIKHSLISKGKTMKPKCIFLTVFFLTIGQTVYANQTLKCVTTDYRLSARYDKSWGMSWIPEIFSIMINSDGIKVLGKNATVTENSEKKLKFFLKTEHKNQNYTLRKFTYFKTNGKFNVGFQLPGGYADPGDIWGSCTLE
jgi:hypothetical protein